MHLRSPLRRASLLGAGALAAASLAVVAPAAHSAPVFTDAETTLSYGQNNVHDHNCPDVVNVTPNATVPVVENGPAASGSVTAQVTSSDGGGDDMSGSSTLSGSASVSSAAGSVKAITFSAQGSASIDAALPASACEVHLDTVVQHDFTFTVTTPGFLDVRLKQKGGMYSELYLDLVSPTSSPYFDTYGDGLNIEHSTRVYLPAGTYDGYVEGRIDLESSTDAAESGNVTANATFSVAGSQTEAVKGKGKRYVTLPAARSCATDSLVPSVTDKRKRVKKVKQIKFFVDDKLVKKVKKPKKGATVNLPVADDLTAEVRAEVTLFPVRKGKPAKVHDVTAAYEACTG